jgi:hypothetical protein
MRRVGYRNVRREQALIKFSGVQPNLKFSGVQPNSFRTGWRAQRLQRYTRLVAGATRPDLTGHTYGFPFGSTPETASLRSLFVALNVDPHARLVAVWLPGTAPDDVQGAVVVLDVRVTGPHIFFGCAVSKCHGNCHGSNFLMCQQKPAGIVSD